MKRLTKKRDRQNVIPLKQNGETKWVICSAGMGDAPTEYLYGEHADRLAAYEDTGLEPCDYSAMAHALEQAERAREDLTEMIRQIGATGLDRLRELAQADKEGRCFVFSFGLGSIAYRIWVHPSGSPGFVTEHKMSTLKDLINAETWDNAYSTRAEAEAALRREQDG